MRSLKKVIQDWLGITAIATRVSEIDLGDTVYSSKQLIQDYPKTPEEAFDEETLKKGYEPTHE